MVHRVHIRLYWLLEKNTALLIPENKAHIATSARKEKFQMYECKGNGKGIAPGREHTSE